MSNKVEDSLAQKIFDWTRYTVSTLLTIASLILIIYAIAAGLAPLEGHPIVLYSLFVFSVSLLGMLEGLQIAILNLERANAERFKHLNRAYVNHKLATRHHGLNVQRFLVGRQFFVVFVVFLSAQLTTYSDLTWNIPRWLFILIIDTGFPGVMVVLSFGQLMPQLVAATHPITFMNIPGAWGVIKIALGFEAIGITHFSWVLTFFTKFIFRMNKGDSVTRVSLTRSKTKSRTKGNSRSSRSRSKKVNPAQKPELFNSFISRNNMSVNIVDVEALYSGAEKGMANARPSAMTHPETMRWLQDESVRNVFKLWGHDSNKSAYPSKKEIVQHLVKMGQPVPRYLLPEHHPQCIPPHIVVLELTRREADRCNSSELKGDEA
jgi:uncharacterized membrane protein